MRKVSPGAAITRLMKSVVPSSAGGANTAICPSFGLDTRYSISLASRTSWMFSVGSMEPEGIQNVRTTKCMRMSATAPARMNASRYSRRTLRDFSLGTVTGATHKITRATANTPRMASRTTGLIRVALLLFFDAGGFAADAILQIEELGAPYEATADDIDLLDARCVHDERALDADAVSDAPHGEALGEAAMLALGHDAFEDLNALFIAFSDARMDLDRVARSELGDFFLFLGVADQLCDVHDLKSLRKADPKVGCYKCSA